MSTEMMLLYNNTIPCITFLQEEALELLKKANGYTPSDIYDSILQVIVQTEFLKHHLTKLIQP